MTQKDLLILIAGLSLWIFTNCGPATTISDSQRTFSTDSSTVSRLDSQLTFTSMIRAIFEDSKGQFWFGSHREGLCRYDGKTFYYYTREQGLPDNQIRRIREDNFGNIWLDTGNGISRYNGISFTSILPESERKPIAAFFEKEKHLLQKWDQLLWFGVGDENGVYCYDGQQLHHLTLPTPSDYYILDINGYRPRDRYDKHAVYGIYRDKTGAMWFGTSNAGLFRFDGEQIECINKHDTIGVVRAIYHDQDDRIWFGNNAIGLYSYQNGQLDNFSKTNNIMGLPGALAINEDKNGIIWIGTYEAGLWRYNPKTENLNLFEDTKTAYQRTISALFKDSHGTLWVGTGKGEILTIENHYPNRWRGN